MQTVGGRSGGGEGREERGDAWNGLFMSIDSFTERPRYTKNPLYPLAYIHHRVLLLSWCPFPGAIPVIICKCCMLRHAQLSLPSPQVLSRRRSTRSRRSPRSPRMARTSSTRRTRRPSSTSPSTPRWSSTPTAGVGCHFSPRYVAVTSPLRPLSWLEVEVQFMYRADKDAYVNVVQTHSVDDTPYGPSM
jgi:hypothetical protein